MPKNLRHPKTRALWTVPNQVADHWIRAGWELVDDDATDPGPLTLVLARTKAEATAYMKDAGLDSSQARYVGDPKEVEGLTADGVHLAVLPSFAKHRKHDELVAALTATGVRLPAPQDTPTALGGDEDEPPADSSTTDTHEE
ncbi:hypothetical protein GXB85_04700 [Cellulomonas sp. APG4]|uniref:hypothetical protein n=1 Tax=Cellulomonas sp. APG4 TaxID=1538656 RepID=UPI00137B1412|nr:hypothetical protein [Cellulomonas sp. APG4]NCT90253.1 hypothetical protein [Cellulomonas sp. APG4]